MNVTQSTVALLTAGLLTASCSKQPANEVPVAAVSVTVNKTSAPIGSPIEATYRFVVAKDAPPFDQSYVVFVHFMDGDEELMWADDHEPPVPTTEWKPGQTIEYRRTTFMAKYPYVGPASMDVGLYSLKDQKRLPLQGDHRGLHAYRVARLELLPQSENIFVIYKDGWHKAEISAENPGLEWQWTKKDATIAFRNPRRDSMFYLRLEGRPDVFDGPQQVTVFAGDVPLDTFIIASKGEIIRKIPVSTSQLGTSDQSEIQIHVDRTFVPATIKGGNPGDVRELGVRVFNAYVTPT